MNERETGPPPLDELSEPLHFCTPDEAALYLDVTHQEFGALCKQYGIGRFHLARKQNQIVYALDDLDNLKAMLLKRT